MTASEFRQAVVMAAPRDIQQKYREEAAKTFIDWNRTSQGDVAQCINLASRYQASFGRDDAHEGDEGKRHRGKRIDPDVLVLSDRLAQTLLPWVERVRIDVFGKPAVPFRSVAAAKRWINKTATAFPQPVMDDSAKAEKKRRLEDIQKHFPALQRLTGYRASWELQGLHFDVTWGHWLDMTNAFAPVDTPLYVVMNAAKAMSRYCYFATDALLLYILLGVKPVLPDAAMRAEAGDAFAYPEAVMHHDDAYVRRPRRLVIHVYSRDITYARFRELYRQAQRMMGTRERTRMQGGVHKLMTLVDELGGEPKKGNKTAFWEKVKAKWNADIQRGRRYNSWRSPMMAYRRLRAKIAEASQAPAPKPTAVESRDSSAKRRGAR